MTEYEDALKWVENDFKGASLGEYVEYKHTIRQALAKFKEIKDDSKQFKLNFGG